MSHMTIIISGRYVQKYDMNLEQYPCTITTPPPTPLVPNLNPAHFSVATNSSILYSESCILCLCGKMHKNCTRFFKFDYMIFYDSSGFHKHIFIRDFTPGTNCTWKGILGLKLWCEPTLIKRRVIHFPSINLCVWGGGGVNVTNIVRISYVVYFNFIW